MCKVFTYFVLANVPRRSRRLPMTYVMDGDGARIVRANQIKKNINMGKNILNYVGVIMVLLGAVLMILAMFVAPMSDLSDQNWYTVGSLVLIILGIVAHVCINKYLSKE